VHVELHAASAFSFLRGASLPEDLVERAAELGYDALALVDRHPDQPFVLDHAGKPVIRGKVFDEIWARGIRALAERPQVTCKLSGLVTEVRDRDWTRPLLEPYVDLVLEAFGPHRVMIGTDWPVCLLRCSYAEWVATAEGLLAGLSEAERGAVWGQTASRVYGL